MTKVFKYGVLVVIFSCVLVLFTSPSIANTPPHTPVKGFYIGMTTEEVDAKFEQHLVTFRQLNSTIQPDIYKTKDGEETLYFLIYDTRNIKVTPFRYKYAVQLVLKNGKVIIIRMNPSLFGITKKLTVSETVAFVKQSQESYGFKFKKSAIPGLIVWGADSVEKGYNAGIYYNNDATDLWLFTIAKAGLFVGDGQSDFENKLKENMD